MNEIPCLVRCWQVSVFYQNQTMISSTKVSDGVMPCYVDLQQTEHNSDLLGVTCSIIFFSLHYSQLPVALKTMKTPEFSHTNTMIFAGEHPVFAWLAGAPASHYTTRSTFLTVLGSSVCLLLPHRVASWRSQRPSRRMCSSSTRTSTQERSPTRSSRARRRGVGVVAGRRLDAK